MDKPVSTNEEKFWKTSFETKAREFAELAATYREFQSSSQEFESELENEMKQTQDELVRTEARLSKTEAQLRKAREENKALRLQYEEEIAGLKAQSSKSNGTAQFDEERLKAEQKKFEEYKRRTTDDIEDLRAKLDRSLEQNELLQAENEDLEQNVQKLKADLHRLQAEGLASTTDTATNQYKSLIAEMKEEVASLNKSITALSEEKETLQARLLEENDLNDQLTREVSDLTDDFMSNSEKIEELEKNLQETTKELEEVREKLKNIPPPQPQQPTVVASPSNKQPAAVVGGVPKEELLALEKKYNEVMAEKKKLEEDLRNQTEISQTYSNEISVLTDQLSSSTKAAIDIEPIQKQLDKKTTALSEAEKKIQKLEEDLFEANSKLSDIEVKFLDADKKLKEAQEGMKEQARLSIANIEEVTRQATQLKERNIKLEAREQELLREIEREKKTQKELKDEIDRERATQDKLNEERTKRNSERVAELQKKAKSGSKSAAVASNMLSLRSVMSTVSQELNANTKALTNDFKTLGSSIAQMSEVLSATKANYQALVNERRKLFDDLQDMKGNIKVFCRVRPLLPHETEAGVEDVIEYPGNNQVSMVKKALEKNKTQEALDFAFDRVYNSKITQTEVFQDVQNLVLSVLDGYNVCIFAYGQTGSGKTHTMEGSPDNVGVNYRSMDALFSRIKSLAPQFQFKVQVSLLEIYNEHLRDLLNKESCQSLKNIEQEKEEKEIDAEKEDGPLQIRKAPNGTVFVTGVNKMNVRSPEEVMEVLKVGASNRAIGATNANQHSSRSHSILMVEVDGFDQMTQNRFHGKLQLIDLAGSERVKETASSGQRLVEATYINRSLSALGDVMNALSKKAPHIPYRNSKLTYLLQDSLGGNSKTMMFVNISPCDKHAQETICSLQFARRVRKVQLVATAAVENAAIHKSKKELEEVLEQKKSLEEKLQKLTVKFDEELKKKDIAVYELNEQLKSHAAKLNQVELAKKKEIADLAAQQNRLAKLTAQGDAKKNEEKLMKKHKELAEKYEQVCNLLKLSQRENKALKDTQDEKSSHVKSQLENTASKTKNLEEELDKAARAARKEALARKKAEEEGQNLEKKFQKELDDKDQLIKVLKDKMRKMTTEMQQLKTATKRTKVQNYIIEDEKLDAAIEPQEDDASSNNGNIENTASESGYPVASLSGSKAQINKRLNEILRKNRFENSNSRLTKPRNWKYRDQLTSIRDIIAPRSAPGSRSSSSKPAARAFNFDKDAAKNPKPSPVKDKE